jgi:hypothetical protein
MICSAGLIIAGIPVYDKKTIWQHLTSEKSLIKADKGEALNEEDKPIDEEVWAEIHKISDANGSDIMTLSGKVSLYDNLNEEGVKEKQNFTLMQSGDNYWMKLDSFERVKINHDLLLIDHEEKEIVSQMTQSIDSVFDGLKVMSSKKLKEMLIKDGTTASVKQEGPYKVLNVVPGNIDAVNEYFIFYDPVSYVIKKIRVAYTSFPYENYMENDISRNEVNQTQASADSKINNISEEEKSDEDEEMEVNVTEYVIEFDFIKNEKVCNANLFDNELYKVEKSGSITFKGKLAKYTKNNY